MIAVISKLIAFYIHATTVACLVVGLLIFQKCPDGRLQSWLIATLLFICLSCAAFYVQRKYSLRFIALVLAVGCFSGYSFRIDDYCKYRLQFRLAASEPACLVPRDRSRCQQASRVRSAF